MSDSKRFLRRNLCMLRGRLGKRGFDCWRHSFTGYNKITGEEKVFFVEYFIMNPQLFPSKVVFGQRSDNLLYGIRPSYVLINAGVWGENGKQLHNFYPADELVVKHGKLNLQVGSCILSESEISGSVSVENEESLRYPECMSDAGAMTWNLSVNKKIAFAQSVSFPLFSRLFRRFVTYWHSQGAKTYYSGTVSLDGVVYSVDTEKSFGIADKNWGSDFPKPSLRLQGSDVSSMINGKTLNKSCFAVVSGGKKRGEKSAKQKLQVWIKTDTAEYAFNSLSLTKKAVTSYSFFNEAEEVHWVISARSGQYLADISVFCDKTEMLNLNYESPNGKKVYDTLLSGGNGYGEIKIFKKSRDKSLELIEHLSVAHVACCYGEYGKIE